MAAWQRDDGRGGSSGCGHDGGMSGMGGMMGGDGRRHDGRRHGRRDDGATKPSADYWRSEEKKVMIRAFDFTVKADTTYRYRVRIVVFNPNKGREDVSPGVDTKAEELRGPWSEATDEVQHAARCHAVCDRDHALLTRPAT